MRRTVFLCVFLVATVAGIGTYVVHVAMPHLPNITSAARLLDGEARGESRQGQKAVFGSILTRMADSRFPTTMHNVVFQPYSNNAELLQYNAMGDEFHENLSTDVGQMILLRTAWWYTLDQFGLFNAPKEARGAHSYCTPEACERQKGYFGTLRRIGQIGNHVFYGNHDAMVAQNEGFAPTTSPRPPVRPLLTPQSEESPSAPTTSPRPKPRPTQSVEKSSIELAVAQAILSE